MYIRAPCPNRTNRDYTNLNSHVSQIDSTSVNCGAVKSTQSVGLRVTTAIFDDLLEEKQGFRGVYICTVQG